MDRREFLTLTAATAAAVAVAACGAESELPYIPGESDPPGGPGKVFVGSDYNEAPMLAERVGAGILPPVAERLPPNPEVVVPFEAVGSFGGQSVVGISNANALFGDPQAVMGTELILRIDSDFSSVTGGLAESWEFLDGGKVQMLYLRRGLKWSDGAEFTADDFLFAWQDLWLHEEFAPEGPPDIWHTGRGRERQPLVMEKVDQFTIKLTFERSFPLVILNECFYPGAQGGLWQPSHYAKQFHPGYAAAEDLAAMVTDGGHESWVHLLWARCRVDSTIPVPVGLPSMNAFIRVDESAEHYTYERNPYYWKVDTEGNQLPYIDSTRIQIIPDREVLLSKLIAGELTFAGRQTQLKDMNLIEQSQAAANLKVKLWKSTFPAKTVIVPNLTVSDPNLRVFLRNKSVRHALSVALDRPHINNEIFLGLGDPRQWAAWPSSKYYQEGDESYWSQHDPDLANQLLDGAGYASKDLDGFRMHPDGSQVTWTCHLDSEQTEVFKVFELAVAHWKAVGLQVELKSIGRSLLNELVAANEITMSGWEGDISDFTWVWNSRLNHPSHGNVRWGRAWQLWLSGDTENELAEEPPDEIKWVDKVWDEMLNAVTDAEHVARARVLWDWFYDYLPGFGTVGIPKPILMKENFANFPESGVWGFSVIRAVPAHPEQFFFKT